ncbi:saccharopine dehydrogenase family protein [Zavarzinella formosa]|uniref:saccharopine dehydrogenase family protein n=1 Tax=Zavarzinella formosa TaxID=360055 RepID=UPI00031E5434|nr:saccharopine dehydrogenase C-terminal domain-containing protein [Zavarzinella formosa]
MTNVVLLGAGKIGRMIARFLADTGDYHVLLADVDANALSRSKHQNIETTTVDASNAVSLAGVMRGRSIVISAMSFKLNPLVAEVAHELGLSYFDLTEDVETTRRVRAIATKAKPGRIFMPQCGLAPGFVSILTNHAAKWFDKLDTVHMRVGALPQFPTNALKYNLTWSTDGLINEYCNPCEAIHNGRRIELLPLEGLEHFDLDGVGYEAFNTSGGLGTFCETLDGRVRELNYKTVRYPGHRDLAAFLVNDLRLSERRDLLKDMLEQAVPITYQDVVIVFCTVTGWRKGRFVQKSEAKKIYQQTIDGEVWSAIQVTTAAAMCAVVDLHVAGRLPTSGFVRQEDVDYREFLANRFGRHYDAPSLTRFSRDVSATETNDADPTE